MSEDDLRPNPEAMLAQANKHSRGKLRLFLGMAPGVGKTYAMLSEAHQRRASGLDVLIGWVDTHKRKDTEALLKGLDVLPRKFVQRGTIQEGTLDVDEIIRRRPSVVVIDEMPHSNPPGSRHAKRWQDIEEILDMGIDVWSALNIQHLESLNGIVERVTGVVVTETVPDRVFDDADEVRLIDLPPDDLLARLSAGKIYLPKVVERAKERYFKKNNLIALRELALRIMASRMETQIRSERLRSTRRSVDDAAFGLLLVMEAPSTDAVREAARIARALSSPWHVVWMEGPLHMDSSSPEVVQLLHYAEELGAQTDVLAGDYGEEVSRYAREHNLSLASAATSDALAANRRRKQLYKAAPELSYLYLSGVDDSKKTFWQRILSWRPTFQLGFEGWWQAAAIVAATTAAIIPLRALVEPTNHAMVFLLGVLFCGVRYGSGPAALSAVLSVLAFDFTVVEPRGSFAVSDTQYLITFAVMLTVGLVAGQLVAFRQKVAKSANNREHQTRMLFDAARELSLTVVDSDAMAVLSGVLNRQLSVESEFWRPTWADEDERITAPDTVELERVEQVLKSVDPAIVRWCYEHQRPAGAGTQTLASSPYWYLPMIAGGEVLGVMVLRMRVPGMSFDVTTCRLIEALAALGASTLQRIESTEDARQTLVSMEAERLRYSLIQSLSHDLRTPITMFRIASESLVEKLHRLFERRRGLPEEASIRDDAEKLENGALRMERLVGNLLEMARLQTGRIVLNKTWVPADELFGTAMSEMGDRLDGWDVQVETDPACPPVYCDEVLIVRTLANLLDNAVKYTPQGTKIVCSARRRGDTVCVSISDAGPGLPEGNPQRLFDPFRRGQKENAVTGVGLGLAICRTIARAHDAEIFASPSSLGGASFTIVFPYVPLETLDDEDVVMEQFETGEAVEDGAKAAPEKNAEDGKSGKMDDVRQGGADNDKEER